jgi:hypothetical protein
MQFLESAYLVSNSDEQKFNTTRNNLFDAAGLSIFSNRIPVLESDVLPTCKAVSSGNCVELYSVGHGLTVFFSNQETGTDIGEIGSKLSSSLSLMGFEEQTSPIEPNQKLSTSVTRNERCLPFLIASSETSRHEAVIDQTIFNSG